ncbi:nicotinate-nucleotide diphosphorylase (carboxylating) [Flavobacterium davisii]|uniref:Probable nicotinate-nucleotide pyrophosphorylase [carboxylating] n=1 Tax=Flavobacterium davisii TaxID=2906077 RepID=A0A246GIB1_9FLAO|nr:carboxylating nicotinate-nucleotide diphosphorylase [Flavobacterium davisii]OWP83997.1 nicotinate-nucleotide diphosphorylase (carboxylating) [Flavobacterium davisii]
MISEKQFQEGLIDIIAKGIKEDIGPGDYSSLACIPTTEVGKAKLLVKDKGIIAGVAFAQMIFNHIDPDLKIDVLIQDGAQVKFGDVVLYVTGNSQSILKAERLVLNSMQRMSAIATKTNHYVELLKGTKTKVLDTRKTTPGFRACEKWAVKIGGGENHRFALYDMIMLKDNHIDFAGGITSAIAKTKDYLLTHNLDLKIIVEARNLIEIQEILKSEGVYRILIDNFNFEDTRTAVQMIDGKCLTESSGNINEKTIREYAQCGVDYISSGALTHSVYNMDLSLKAV